MTGTAGPRWYPAVPFGTSQISYAHQAMDEPEIEVTRVAMRTCCTSQRRLNATYWASWDELLGRAICCMDVYARFLVEQAHLLPPQRTTPSQRPAT